MENKLELRFQDNAWNGTLDFVLIAKEGRSLSVAQPCTMEKKQAAEEIGRPTFCLPQPAVQQLFNDLWKAGFRPKDGTGNSGHVAAIQYHLEDMRRLVFNKQTKSGGRVSTEKTQEE